MKSQRRLTWPLSVYLRTLYAPNIRFFFNFTYENQNAEECEELLVLSSTVKKRFQSRSFAPLSRYMQSQHDQIGEKGSH